MVINNALQFGTVGLCVMKRSCHLTVCGASRIPRHSINCSRDSYCASMANVTNTSAAATKGSLATNVSIV